ncbi:hypothetical protein D3C76_1819290 [compost metagenome]
MVPLKNFRCYQNRSGIPKAFEPPYLGLVNTTYHLLIGSLDYHLKDCDTLFQPS